MRINVNLASQKYEDARQFYLRWGSALALAIIVTFGLAFIAWSKYQDNSSQRARINQLQKDIASLDQERQQAEAVLNRPENQDVRDQKNFWNDVFDLRSFSWTQLFSDLEKIMPEHAFVISAQPTLTKDRQLQLHLLVAGASHDDAVQVQSRMEHSDHFHAPLIKREGPRTEAQTQGPGGRPQLVWEFEIETFYTPASQVQPSGTVTKAGL